MILLSQVHRNPNNFYINLCMEEENNASIFMMQGCYLFLQKDIFLREVQQEATRHQQLFVFRTVHDCIHYNLDNVALMLLRHIISELED